MTVRTNGNSLSRQMGEVCHAIGVATSDDLPDFRIPHAEKIDWMIETHGWALEPVEADYTSEPPRAGYSYTIGMPPAHGFADIVVFGLTPVASKGLIDLVVEHLAHGATIELNTPIIGLLDNDLRCVFAEVDAVAHADLFQTATKWYRGGALEMVQLVWPDRSGYLPGESGFDTGLRFVQPLIAAPSWGGA